MNILQYSIDIIRDEAKQLVEQRVVSPHQPIYTLCQFIPPREWRCIEVELEKNDFLLRDRIIDLLGHGCWLDD